MFPTKELQDLNPGFAAEGRDYLSHNFYDDYSSLHILKKDFLAHIIAAEPYRFLGNVSEADLLLIRGLIKSARTLKPSLKKTYGLFL